MSRQPIRIEGGLFAADFLENLDRGDVPGQRPEDFGLPTHTKLDAHAASIFEEARMHWFAFKQRQERLGADASPAALRRATRDAWLIPLLSALGYNVTSNDATAPISHRASEDPNAPPLHLVGAHQSLDRTDESARPRRSPHATLQTHLNQTDALWGIVTNGLRLRVLRNSTYITRQAYLEVDLEAIFEEELFADFLRFFRLVHRSRLPKTSEDAAQCWLERYHQASVQQGERVRDQLRDGVVKALDALGNALLKHPRNDDLRAWVRQAGGLAFYKQLLSFVYRLLFLLVAEERRLMGKEALYYQSYGVSRLRRSCEQRRAYTDDVDLWHGLRALWAILRDETLAKRIGAPPLNGTLFEPLVIDEAVISNRDLLTAFWHLSFFDNPPRRVNYAALDTEELGSVYESLLDYHPVVNFDSLGRARFELAPGSERKSTGSYYTPPQLVSELIRSALEPVIAERLKEQKNANAKEQALLSIKVCDPACGSGHFLLAAARRLGKELARIRTGEDEPAPEQVRLAIRDVVAHCIYGVDKNPLAVELARVALWLESHAEDKPLTFLEHRIKCGDSLVGVFDVSVLKDGIPDEAFSPLEGDDRKRAASLKRQNKTERAGQMNLFGWESALDLKRLAQLGQELDTIPDDSPEQVRRKRERYETRAKDPTWQRQKQACDLWTAAFFQTYLPNGAPITTDIVRRALAGQTLPPQTLAQAEALAAKARFFHWPLEFPEVFQQGGFDLLLANPPWERIKLQEQEFFASRDTRIAQAPNAAARKRLIECLPQENPDLWEEYRRALHTAESVSRFLRASGDYPLTGRGDINTYSVFAERIRQLLAPHGRAGIILPTGIATDATNQFFFADLVEKEHIVSLFDFENREGIFPSVHRSYKFCLLTLRGERERAGAGAQAHPLTLAFFATRAEHLRDPRRVFTLRREDIARINPNTRTLPVFRTRQDAELTRAIYARVPVLVNEAAQENAWGVCFLAMFHMSNDSHLFRTRAELEAAGYRLEGNRFVRGAETYLPLYEAKMIWHYDHRFGTYEGVGDRSSTHLPTPDEHQHADPRFLALPWYWVSAEEVQARLGEWKRGWLLGFRNVTNATNERTAIFSLLPLAGVGNSLPILLLGEEKTSIVACLVGNLSALAFDWVARQKLAGVNMNFFYVEQFPVLPPSAYTADALRFIVPRVLELTYTAWDLAPFAADVWRDADEALRAALQAQWEANRAATGGVDPAPPAWATSEGAPFPPFKWDEPRRAVLRAELDAYYARLYGLTRKQLRYLLDPADLTARELADILDPWEEVSDPLDPQGYAERAARSDFPSETFRVLKEKELREYGEYRTRRLVLEAWARLPR